MRSTVAAHDRHLVRGGRATSKDPTARQRTSRCPSPTTSRPASPTAYADEALAWKRTKWLGRRVSNAATDLVTYQEIVDEVRPEWIIETGTGNGGRAHFLRRRPGDLIGEGRVISIEQHAEGHPTRAPRDIPPGPR
ncbi:MAG: CmcI family methyltransferase [Acidimicrobiales bacterium]|nr:CmcI family methyltransferase [Acidimicrobiales bacterium]